ncbi:MAG: dual specificity protein phosphatase family protein [Erysipelotrichaceae bacterium]|nr:dual specificity protein phosphatase family protein [Erysipelotrichaceae bacterium]
MDVKICSRKEIQKLIHSKFPENTAVISFFGEDEKPVYFPANITHIRLNIDDVLPSEVEDPESYHMEDFRRVARFVFCCRKAGMNIVCQCEAGISRSAGTAAAIKEFFDQDGLSIFTDYRYIPNQVFYKNLYRCLKEEATEYKTK